MRILIKDNYFNNPDQLRHIALSIESWKIDNEAYGPPSGWRGQRSLILSKLNNTLLNRCEQDIFNLCYNFFNLENFTYKSAPPEYRQPTSEFMITSYFHITTEETRGAFADFWQDRFHKDPNTSVAGVVYLSPDAPLKAGTSVFDGENNQMVNVENKYNRLVAYPGSKIHGLSDVFGDTVEMGRLTYTFFIHEKNFIEHFK